MRPCFCKSWILNCLQNVVRLPQRSLGCVVDSHRWFAEHSLPLKQTVSLQLTSCSTQEMVYKQKSWNFVAGKTKLGTPEHILSDTRHASVITLAIFMVLSFAWIGNASLNCELFLLAGNYWNPKWHKTTTSILCNLFCSGQMLGKIPPMHLHDDLHFWQHLSMGCCDVETSRSAFMSHENIQEWHSTLGIEGTIT